MMLNEYNVCVSEASYFTLQDHDSMVEVVMLHRSWGPIEER